MGGGEEVEKQGERANGRKGGRGKGWIGEWERRREGIKEDREYERIEGREKGKR